MRLLRYSGVLLLLPLAACPGGDDGDNPFDPTTGVAMTTTGPTPPEETSTGQAESTDEGPPMTTGESATGDSSDSGSGSSDDGPSGQACGNGVIEGTEQCDCGMDFCTPAGLNGGMCLGQMQVLPNGQIRHYTGGILNCNPASCQYDFAQCSFCGDTLLNGMEICELEDDGPSCQALGMGTSTNPLPCAETCLEWDTTCCAVPLPKECQ